MSTEYTILSSTSKVEIVNAVNNFTKEGWYTRDNLLVCQVPKSHRGLGRFVSVPLFLQPMGKSVPEPMAKVLGEVRFERYDQDATWGGPDHDDQHDEKDWRHFIMEYVDQEKGEDFRDRMVKVAALAVAAIQSTDRLSEGSDHE